MESNGSPAVSAREILVVDDDPEWLELFRHLLREDSHKVRTAQKGRDGLKLLSSATDLVLLDINLPDVSGFELCGTIKERREHERTLVLLMSSTVHELEQGYEVGADDYFVKDGHPQDIRPKINFLLRRHSLDTGILRRGEMELDPRTQALRIGNKVWSQTGGSLYKDRHLTPTEFRILYRLIEANGQPVGLKRLSQEAFPGPSAGSSRKIEVTISRLRSKLPQTISQKILAIRNAGYVFSLDACLADA